VWSFGAAVTAAQAHDAGMHEHPDLILSLAHQHRRELQAEMDAIRLARDARRSRPSLGASASAWLRRIRSAAPVTAKPTLRPRAS
jgi:hypothetical protein